MLYVKKISTVLLSFIISILLLASFDAFAGNDANVTNDMTNKFEKFVFDNGWNCLSTREYSNKYNVDEIESTKFHRIDVNEDGYISYVVDDFDSDSKQELMVVVAKNKKVYLEVYEYDDNEDKIVLMDSYDIMQDCMFKENDSDEGFFSLKYKIDLFYKKVAENIKIFVEAWFDNSPVCDGYAWSLKEFEYKNLDDNKKGFVKNNNLQLSGSDFFGKVNIADTSYKEEEDIIKALIEYQFNIVNFYWGNMIMTQDKSLIPIVRLDCSVDSLVEDNFINNYYNLDETKKKNAVLYANLKFDYYKKEVIDINKLDFTCGKSFNYTKNAIVPNISLKERSYQLKKDRDYVVTCSNNVYPGKATCKIVGKGNYSGTITCNFNIVVSNITRIKETIGANTIKITWTNNKSFSGVSIEKYNASKKKYIPYKVSTTNIFLDSKLVSIKTYAYRLRPYVSVNGKKVYGAYSKIYKLVTKPSVPALKCQKKNKKAVLSWKKVPRATGYNIYRKQNNGKFVKIKTLGYNKVSLSDNIVKGRKYSYKMVAYKKIGKTVITSAYSKVLSIKL